MSRDLTDEERRLWERLSESVRPLAKRPAKRGDSVPKKTAGGGTEPQRVATQKAAAATAPAKPGPALAPLEARSRRRLARGLTEVDARIDLHGMRQERAFIQLRAFLRQAQARGHRVVLVVTGKGRASEEGRGVLYRSVPAWLASPDLRHLVVGFEEAGRRHGGAGALYVRVRRRREARQV